MKVEARLDVPRGAAVEGQHVAGYAAGAKLRRDGDGLLGRSIIGLGDPEPQSPQRDVGRASGKVRVVVEHFCRVATGNQEQVERLIVDDGAVGAVRPVGMADTVRHPARRVDEYSPRGLSRTEAPAERHVLVRQTGVDAERVFHLRFDQLAALVERAEFLAQPVHGLARSERKGGDPLLPRARPADDGQARETAEVLVGNRSEGPLVVLK